MGDNDELLRKRGTKVFRFPDNDELPYHGVVLFTR